MMTSISKSNPRIALAALALTMLLSSLGVSIANVGLPTLASAFGATNQRTQWVVVAYLLALTIALVAVGRLGDTAGRRRVLLGGIALFALASIACAIAPTLELLVVARAAQGLGAAAMTALTVALVGETVPKTRAGAAMGLLGTTSAIGTALGPSLGGALIAAADWRALFWVTAPIAALAYLLVLRGVSRDTSTPAIGAQVAIAALLRDPALGAALASSALVAAVVMATLVVGPFHLSGALGLDPARTGLVMSCGPAVSALTGVPAGRWVDRFGATRTTLAGLGAMAIGAALLAFAPPALGVAGYVVPLAVLTAGYALFQAANNTAVLRDVAAGRRGAVSGLLSLARYAGLAAGASALGAMYAAAGFGATFAVASGLVCAALALAIGNRRTEAGVGTFAPSRVE